MPNVEVKDMRYGSGISFEGACKLDKERIRKAFENKTIIDWDEDGNPICEDVSPEQAQEEIISIFDNCVYQGVEALRTGRVLEQMLKDATGKVADQKTFMKLYMEDSAKGGEYEYDGDVDLAESAIDGDDDAEDDNIPGQITLDDWDDLK